jgi:hypothetical protein
MAGITTLGRKKRGGTPAPPNGISIVFFTFLQVMPNLVVAQILITV